MNINVFITDTNHNKSVADARCTAHCIPYINVLLGNQALLKCLLLSIFLKLEFKMKKIYIILLMK